MKKIIIILFVISLMFLISNKNEIIIPSESIRFRIIANSNSIEDQSLKNTIKNDLINNIIPNTYNENYKNSKELINNAIPQIEEALKKYNIKYKINYGNNYFPEKIYKGIKYPSGNYESLVITLDNGAGNNFWCVLYPSLCLIEENSNSSVEYKSLVKEIIDNYHKNNV